MPALEKASAHDRNAQKLSTALEKKKEKNHRLAIKKIKKERQKATSSEANDDLSDIDNPPSQFKMPHSLPRTKVKLGF